ncbi:MAG: LytR C-terminal domain-containing protein [Candidatus Levybacteria bacterium]|nr:LytR C-terminal domain-containing protein [Candidatus Levybacteria bacterium]
MPNKKRKSSDNQSLKLALIFFISVFTLVIIAVSLKVISVITSSSFNGKNRFTIAIIKDSSDIISFAPDTNSISVLHVASKKKLTGTDVGKYLKIPIDGQVILGQNSNQEFNKLFLQNNNVEMQMRITLTNYYAVNTSLTIIDVARLWLFTKTVASHAIYVKNYSIPDNVDLSSELTIDKILSQLFSDSAVSAEKVSIQIVNGTGVSGLGNRLARLITNMGGNVISVSTSDKLIETSEIDYFDKKNYTLEKLYSILKFPIKKIDLSSNISDLIIILGKDSLPALVF